jgi:tRNA-dihydrouridine synthase A
MRDACALPVTVKHRIGIDRTESYGFVRDFVGTLADRGGCQVFIVHARNAWLQGLSPKENREVPPLRYEQVYRLKADFPQLTIVLNGGVGGADVDAQIASHLAQVDGVMVGRHAYHEPWALAGWDERFFGAAPQSLDRAALEACMVAYMDQVSAQGTPWAFVARHMLGLHNARPGARRWRQVWSNHLLKAQTPASVSALAQQGLGTAPMPTAVPWAGPLALQRMHEPSA